MVKSDRRDLPGCHMKPIMKTLAILIVASVLSVGVARAQELTRQQQTEMLDCTFHRTGGPWVDQNLYSDGKARFTYLYERGKPSVLYVAFWNPEQTVGKLVAFEVFKTADQHDTYAIVNDGWIRDSQGRLDVEDVLGGVYENKELSSRLPRLKERPLHVVVVHQLRPTSATCTSPLDKPKPQLYRPRSP